MFEHVISQVTSISIKNVMILVIINIIQTQIPIQFKYLNTLVNCLNASLKGKVAPSLEVKGLTGRMT